MNYYLTIVRLSITKNQSLSTLKAWISQNEVGKQRLKIAYESTKDEAKRTRTERKSLAYIPTNKIIENE